MGPQSAENRSLIPIGHCSVAVLSGCALLGGAIVLLAGIWINQRLPVDRALQDVVVSSWAHLVRPERDMTLYHLWLVSAVVIQWLLIKRYYKELENPRFLKNLQIVFWAALIFVAMLSVMTYNVTT